MIHDDLFLPMLIGGLELPLPNPNSTCSPVPTEPESDEEKKMRKIPPPKQTNPPCIGNVYGGCGATAAFVKMVNAHSLGRRVFECRQCNIAWQQIPPDDMTPGQDPKIMVVTKRKLKKPSGGYGCRRCGAITKRGHHCTNPSEKKKKKTTEAEKKTTEDQQISIDDIPGIYTLDDVVGTKEYMCVSCNKEGTFESGRNNTLLTCASCNNLSIHFNCMDSFCDEWMCPMCECA